MPLVSETDLTLVLAIAAGFGLFVAAIAVVLWVRTASARQALADRLSQIERGADHTERRMFQILNSIPVALVETDSSGRFVFANRSAHALLGRKDAELIGLRFHSATWGIAYPDGKLIPPDLLPAARALRGQTVKGFQHLIINPHSKKRFLVSVTAMPLMNEIGEVIGSTAAMVETEGLITPQGEAAPSAADHWAALSNEILLALDPDGKVATINRTGAITLGAEPGQIEGRDWFERFVPEDERSAAKTAFRTLIDGGPGATGEGEGMVQAADGTVRRISWRSSLVTDERGRPTAVVASGREVVEAPAALAQHDPRFETLAEAAEAAVWTADAATGRLTYVSPAFERLYGFTLADLEYDLAPWMTRVREEDRAAVEAAWEGAIAGEVRDVEFTFQTPGEASRPIRDRLVPVRDGSGEVVGIGGAARDVSDKRLVESELGESRALIRGLFEAPGLYVGVLESLGDDFRFAAADAGTQKLFGRPVQGVSAHELGFTASEIADWVGAIEGAGAETGSENGAEEHPFTIGGRETGWRIGVCVPLPRSPDGRARAGYVAVDVSERRKGEEAHRESEAKSRALVEAAPVLVWSSTGSGWCDWTSPRFTDLTGIPAERLHGLGWQEAIHPDDRPKVAAAWTAMLAGEAELDLDARLQAADGNWRWHRLRASAERDAEGHAQRWFAAAADVSEPVAAKVELEHRLADVSAARAESDDARRRAEQRVIDAEHALARAQRHEAIGRLTGGVAQDFNSLLSVMIGALDMIKSDPDKADRVRRLSEAALAAGRRGERLTGQLMAFTQKQEDDASALDLGAVLRGFEPALRRTLGEGVAFETHLPDQLGWARVDAAELQTALTNLAANARDAVAGTGGTVTLSADPIHLQQGALPGLADGDYLRVTLTDTGPGMSAEIASRAFEPFFTTKPAGTAEGLGLAQVAAFARQCGGQARIDSEPGRGAIVSLILPAVSAPAVAAEEEPPAAEAPAAANQGWAELVEPFDLDQLTEAR